MGGGEGGNRWKEFDLICKILIDVDYMLPTAVFQYIFSGILNRLEIQIQRWINIMQVDTEIDKYDTGW